MAHSHTIRVTGVLLHEGKVLVVQQQVDELRRWSLPGGKLEAGETISDGLKREMHEETGLSVRITKLLYICDKPEDSLIHVTFLLEADSLADLRLPTNEFDANPIFAIEFVSPEELPKYGFTQKWAELVANGFPGSPRYAGLKTRIGLA